MQNLYSNFNAILKKLNKSDAYQSRQFTKNKNVKKSDTCKCDAYHDCPLGVKKTNMVLHQIGEIMLDTVQ